jgi:hypothetical protein
LITRSLLNARTLSETAPRVMSGERAWDVGIWPTEEERVFERSAVETLRF